MSETAIRWELYQDKQDYWRFRFRAGNGEIVCSSEGYYNRQDCEDGISVIEKAIRSTVGVGSYSTLPRIQVQL